jgi:hypothetical protein
MYEARNVCSPTKFHCVRCGGIWGDGVDIGSSGFCLTCLAEWALNKKSCFGNTVDCCDMSCSYTKYCKECYGIR